MMVNGKVVALELKDLKNKSKRKNLFVLSGERIKRLIIERELLIKPYDKNAVGPCDINLRISENYARIKNTRETLDLYDYKDEIIDEKYFILERGKEYVIQPNEHLLIESKEYLEMPNFLTGLIGLRSTFSRLGLSTPPTFIDPGFKGKIVLHLIGGSFPIKLHENMSVFKVIFMYVDSNNESYNGKYQNQKGIMLPKMDPS